MSSTDIRTEVSAVRSDAGGLLQKREGPAGRGFRPLASRRLLLADRGWPRHLRFIGARGTSYDVAMASLLPALLALTAIIGANIAATFLVTPLRTCALDAAGLKAAAAGVPDLLFGNFCRRSFAHKKGERGGGRDQDDKSLH